MKFVLFSLFLIVSLSAQSIRSYGNVFINSKPLSKKTIINLGDTVETGQNSVVRFNIGKDAFRAKENTKFKFQKIGKIKVLNIVKGSVMAVFDNKHHAIATPNMTTTLSGGGTFTEVKKSRTYFCICYGKASLDAHNKITKLEATHHNMVWVTPTKVKLTMDMEHHRDKELRRLEIMVGRRVPFR